MNEKLILKMTEYFSDDPKRVQHFIKVSAYARIISELENVDKQTADTLYTAAIVHDIGIKPAEEMYGKGNCGGDLQQRLGVKPAKEILLELGFSQAVTERVCFLVAHHHTYEDVEGIDWQILLEADFLVNAYEDNLKKESIKTFRDKVFKTTSGRALLDNMFGLNK